jgi:hypothetical protein
VAASSTDEEKSNRCGFGALLIGKISLLILRRFDIEDHGEYATGTDLQKQASGTLAMAKTDSAPWNRFHIGEPRVRALILKAADNIPNFYSRVGLADVPISVFADGSNWEVNNITVS